VLAQLSRSVSRVFGDRTKLGSSHMPSSVDTPLGVIDLGIAEQVLVAGRAVVMIGSVGEVLIVRTRRGVFAMQNQCPHAGRMLSDADIRGTTLRCRGHGRTYSMTAGRASGAAPGRDLRLLPAWIEGGHLLVKTS
jgi:nitrite reductase/ring-hydroxylating ferredoxin subunit